MYLLITETIKQDVFDVSTLADVHVIDDSNLTFWSLRWINFLYKLLVYLDVSWPQLSFPPLGNQQ